MQVVSIMPQGKRRLSDPHNQSKEFQGKKNLFRLV
jgi:hypothetical protein